MNRIRIAYFLSSKAQNIGGADHTLLMQAFLMRSCFDVTVVLPCDEYGNYNVLFQEKCEKLGLQYSILKYDTAYSIKDINLIDCGRDVRQIEEFIERECIGFLHSVQVNPAVECIARKRNIPHLMNIYSLEEWEWKIPCADIFPEYVSCDSDYCLKKWKAYLNCKGKCVRVFDEPGFKKKVLKEKETIIVGAAGAFFEYKNQLEVIRAVEIEICQGRKMKLVFAGNTNTVYANECRDYVREHHLQEQVSILGLLDDMKGFYEQIDVFICGSKRESFPAVVVEAFACGIPVISTPVAGIPEILADQKNAYLTKGYDASELAEALERFWRDYRCDFDRLTALLDNEEKTYRQYFSAQAVRRQLGELYDEIWKNSFGTEKVQRWNDISKELSEMSDRVENRMREMGMGSDDVSRMHKRLFFFSMIRKKLGVQDCYIWGAGKWGSITRALLECLADNIQIIAFIDAKEREPVLGIPVISKENMSIGKDTVIFISFAKEQEEAAAFLQSKGMEFMKNFYIMA